MITLKHIGDFIFLEWGKNAISPAWKRLVLTIFEFYILTLIGNMKRFIGKKRGLKKLRRLSEWWFWERISNKFLFGSGSKEPYLFTFEIFSSDTEIKISRNYQKIDKFLSELGGILHFFLLIGFGFAKNRTSL